MNVEDRIVDNASFNKGSHATMGVVELLGLTSPEPKVWNRKSHDYVNINGNILTKSVEVDSDGPACATSLTMLVLLLCLLSACIGLQAHTMIHLVKHWQHYPKSFVFFGPIYGI